MASQPLAGVLRHLRTLTAGPRPEPDRELLGRYVARRDEAAFAELLRRHGLLVWRLARRLLPDEADAEDVFQATFLTLADKAASIRKRASVGAWLYGVAACLARRARAAAARRAAHEGRAARPPAPDPLAELTLREARAVLDEELARLPERLRAPLVLCYLQGATRDEAARQLGWSPATLKRRLERGRGLLRARLAGRGLALSSALLAALCAPASAAVPAALVEATARAGQGMGVSASVRALVHGMTRALFLARLRTALALVAVLGALAAGAGWAARTALAPEPPEVRAEVPRPDGDPPQSAGRPAADLHGDPLPPEAVARAGTTRFRHGGCVRAVAFLPDGKSLVSADESGARLWDAATGQELRHFAGEGQLNSLSLSPDGKVLAAAHAYPGVARLWDVATGKEVGRFPCPAFSSVTFSPDGKTLASVGFSGKGSGMGSTIHLWDAATGREVRELKGHDAIAWSVAFSPDGRTLYTGGADNVIRVWEVATGKELGVIEGSPNVVARLAVSPDGKLLASVGMTYDKYDPSGVSQHTFNKVHLWDVATRKEAGTIEGPPIEIDRWGFPSEGFQAIAFTPDGKTLVAGSVGRAIRLYDVATGKERAAIPLRSNTVLRLAVSPDGKTVAAAGYDRTVRLWDLATGKEAVPTEGHQDAVTAVALSPDGKTLASGSADRTIRLWDRATGRELRRLAGHPGGVAHLAFLPDGRTLVSAGPDKTVRFWDVAAGKELRQLPGHDSSFSSRWALAPDGKTLALVTGYSTVALRDTATGKLLHELPEEMALALAFAPDGQTLFSCDGDTRVHRWDVATGKGQGGFETLPVPRHRQFVPVVFSPDGRRVAVNGLHQEGQTYHLRTHLYDLAAGKEVGFFEDVGRPFAFSPDGRFLAFQGWRDATVRLGEVATRRECLVLAGHEGPINALAFAADGRTLASASDDTSVLVWDLTGRGGKKPAKPSAKEGGEHWSDLAGADAGRAYRAVRALAAAPEQAVPFLGRHLRPVTPVEARRLEGLVADLDNDRFETREAAARELEWLDKVAEPALAKALEKGPPLEVRRRLEALVQKLDDAHPSGEWLRTLRALAVLEYVGTAEALRLLEALAKGAPEARPTREARTCLDRLR